MHVGIVDYEKLFSNSKHVIAIATYRCYISKLAYFFTHGDTYIYVIAIATYRWYISKLTYLSVSWSVVFKANRKVIK